MKNFAYRHYFSRVSGFSKGTKRTHRWFDPVAFARKGVASLLSGLLVLQPVLLQAQQLTPDVSAPIGNQPGIGAAPNGVPLVDIVTPNQQGLSHNKYGDFNVGTPGLILNNHNGELGNSKLGGVTPGNANLKNSGPASVILNEVTSGNRSALQGATEVFGGRADVIIANPNGITCDGCGFINTPRATLTTGTPDIDGTGRLSGFTVQGGDVTFGSKGGNFASGDGTVDLFDIVSRRIQIDGPVNGKNLRLTAGRQKFDYTTGEATALSGTEDAGEFAIDGSALGAMQADRIKIVVTDKGAGVRMRNDMAANAGELTLSADGKISLGNASGRDGVSVQSKSRQVEAKKITSKKKVVVKSAKGITLEAVSADEDVILGNGDGLLSVAGDVGSLRNIELTSFGAITAGNIAAGKNASLQAGQGIAAGQLNVDGAANLTTASGNIALSGTTKAGGGVLTMTATSGSITAASLVSFNNMALTAGTDITTGDILSGGALVASARSLKAGNVVSGVDVVATNAANGAIQIGSTGDMRLATSGGIDVASLLSAGNLNIAAAALAAQNVTSHGTVVISGDTNVSGQILGSGDVSIAGANITAGAIISGVDFVASRSSNGAIIVGNTGDTTLLAQAGTINVGTLLSAGNFLGDTATFKAANVTSYGAANIAGTTTISGQLLAGSDVTINGSAISIGAAVAGVDLTALRQGNIVLGNGARTLNLTATAGDLKADRLLSSGNTIASASRNLSANILTHGDLSLTAGGNLTLSGQSLSGGNATLTAGSMNIGTLVSGVDFAATEQSGRSLTLKPGAASATSSTGNAQSGQMTLTATGEIDAGTLLSAQALTVNAGSFNATNVTSNSTANITGATTISGQLLAGSDLAVTGAAINIATAVAGVDLVALAKGTIATSNVASGLNLIATAGDLITNRLLSSGTTVASATRNLSANVVSRGDLTLTAGGAVTLSGQSLAGGNATINGASLNIGTLVSGVDFAATEQSGGSLILKTGLANAGQMLLNASSGSIFADQLLSGGDLKAKAQQNVSYNSLQSFASADLNVVLGAISLDKNTVAKGNIALTLQSLDLSNNRSKLATAGNLIVNAASADLSNSTLIFGGIALNLSGSADAANSKIRAVTADGGSGDITINAQTISTTSATALLAANDLTLTLASLTNPGQLAANRNLTLNIAGSFTNTASGLVYAGQDGRLYVAGDLLNDQGAILVGNDLTIAANANGERNQSITNVSGLIKAGRDADITTANLTNKRSTVPTWSTVVVSNDAIAKFELNPETWGKPLGHIFVNSNTNAPLNLYPGEDYAELAWMAQLYGVITFADGTSYRTRSLQSYEENTPWKWGDSLSSVQAMRNWLLSRYPGDGKGNILLTPDLQSKSVIIVNRNDPFAWTFTWDEGTQMRQSIEEQRFDGNLSPEALIQTGRNLNIDATILNNAHSSIEAGGNAKLTGSVLNNEGVALYRTVTSKCEATGGCEAYDANGNRDGTNDLDKGNSRVTGQTIVGGAFGNIKAAGNMDISGFASVNNTSAPGSIAGGAQLSTAPVTNDPTAALNGLTAAGALFTPNSAIANLLAEKGISVSGNSLQAGGLPLSPAEIIAALGSIAPKPDSGGFGGTIPGQVFLYETRAEFLDVSKFYGSGYFINRIGYNPDRSIPFMGDAYFENQLVDQQLRQLINQGLGKGSFIPGSDAIEQMKVLLDRGADFASANGLTIGEKLSPELIANLTETMVWYEKKTVNGIEVLVPTVYIANADKANLTVAGAIISGDTVNMNVSDVSNAGVIQAKTDLKLQATNITATGGSFTAGNDLSLSASQNLTIAAADMQIGGETFVKAGSGVQAGGNASLSAGDALTLRGAEVKAGNDVDLTGQTVTLDTAKATNNGSDNVIGTNVQSGGDTTITAKQDVNVIGSNVAAGGNLGIEAEQGSVNVVAAGVEKKVNGVAGTRMSQTDSTFAQTSNLSSGGDTSIKAGDDILISGSKVKAGGDVSIEAKDDINITVAQQRTETIGSEVKQGSETHIGSEISSGGSASVAAGDKTDVDNSHDLNIIGSKIDAKGKVDLSATDNVTIAEARDTGYSQLDTSSKGIFSKKESHSRTETETAVGSSISGGDGVDISSGKDTTISASNIQAGTADNKADLNIDAGGDLIIASGKNTSETDASKSKSGLLSKKSDKGHTYDETTVASELGASGNVNLNAGDNVVISGSKVTAGENIAVEGDSVSIIGAQEQHDASSSSKKSGLGAGSGDGFYSVWGKEEKSSKENTVANVSSELSAGNDVSIKARETDVNIVGSKVEAGNDIALDAARDVNILPGAESYASEDKEKRSGFGVQVKSSEGSASIGIGFGSSKDETKQGAETNAVSSLKAGNNVIINAGRDANLQAARVEAENDVAITAERDVNLLAAQDKTNYEHMHEELFAGITASVSTGLVSSAKSIADAAGKVAKVSDGYSAANAGFAGLKAADALNNISSMFTLDENGNAKGNVASASVGVGFEYSKSKESAESSTPVVTGIRGGNSVSIEAKSGDINSHGAQIVAGYDENGVLSGGAGDISLKAGNDINLESAQATNSSSSSSTSAGASVGVSAGVSITGVEFGPYANAHGGVGKSKGNGTTQVNTHVNATGNITIESGRDTNLKGAVVEGDTVTADVGRDLNIISVPDTGENSNKSVSLGVSTSGISPGYSTGSGETNWISEQSGLVSKGEMDVTVEGNTHLGAGKIVSKSGDLTLDTGTLTHEDFSGSKQYEGFDVQANIDLTGKQQQPDQTSQPKNSAEGTYQLDDTRQEVRATVGPGEIIIRDKDKQAELEASGQTEDLAALNRDPDMAYEITKDKHVEIDYYLSDTSVKAALEAGKSTVEIVIDALGRMANDGKLTPQDYDTARRLAKYKDDPNVIAQLNACGQRQGFNQFSPLDWLITPAHAQAPCMISTTEGTFPISVIGAETCRTAFAVMTGTAGLMGL
ncbi:hemagglutinin repeat-containing protein, partial [Brucella rhizosphaerae]